MNWYCGHCRIKRAGECSHVPGWYAPRFIRYCLPQVEWLLEYAELLHDGHYPSNPKETGYIDAPIGTKTRPRHASYENTIIIIGLLDERLAKCGLDRVIIEGFYTSRLTVDELARRYSTDIDQVQFKLSAVLSYVSSGKIPRWVDTLKRKGMTYREWSDERYHDIRRIRHKRQEILCYP